MSAASFNVDGEIGVISDTHGLLRPEALEALDGCGLILHAGDIGSQSVVTGLRDRAQLIIVRGNIDKGSWGEGFPPTEACRINGRSIYLLHNIGELDLDPEGLFDAVIYGHSHQPGMERKAGVLYFNPGSAGPRRFKLPVCVGRLKIDAEGVSGRIIKLDV